MLLKVIEKNSFHGFNQTTLYKETDEKNFWFSFTTCDAGVGNLDSGDIDFLFASWIDKVSSFWKGSCAADSTITRGDFDGDGFDENDELSLRFLSRPLDMSFFSLKLELISFSSNIFSISNQPWAHIIYFISVRVIFPYMQVVWTYLICAHCLIRNCTKNAFFIIPLY